MAALVQNCSSEFTVCFLSSAVRCQPLSRALGLRREKHHYWGKDLGISLAIRLRLSANQLGLPKSSRFINYSSCQNSWVASLENRAGWLKVSLAQKRFGFINRLRKIVVLS
ncbi:hypothetical protein EXZ60_17640 [Vibrio sp. 1151_11]|uniref:hypothetical protein n=1 Tax=Vibrio sp. 1151_11 TaxID=2527670 RepID=UPI0024054118|nr:hypothetical protein [Vibrio sp. 1151_11]MDF9390603.1 hypothetical protein [Vibrio sp. 1151_11]